MATHSVRDAFAALASANNSLITATSEDVAKYKMHWAEGKYVNNKKVDKSKGLWRNPDGSKLVLSLIGVVDLSKSTLGAYGSCYWNKDRFLRPTPEELGKSKFSLAITHPDECEGDPDNDLTLQVWNQDMRLDEMQSNSIRDQVAEGDRKPMGTTDWVHFEERDDAHQAWAHISLGYAFSSSSKHVKGKDLNELSPKKAASTSTALAKKLDIELDPDEHFANAGEHKLKHNDELPCFTEDGVRIGCTSKELVKELFHGRWVRADVELIMWNMVGEGKQVYQLAAVRVVALNCPLPRAVGGMAFAPLQASSYKTVGGEDDLLPKDKPTDGEETLSDGSSKDGKGAKRALSAEPEGGPAKKKGKN